MKRFAILCMLFATLGVLPASGQTVVGYFEGPVDRDRDGIPDNAGSGAIAITGWTASTDGIQRVVIQVDGQDLGQAIYGRPRPDAQSQVSGLPDAAGPGFLYNINTTLFDNGVHTVTAKVVTNSGTEIVLGQSYHVLFNNTAPTLAPFGKIELPVDGTEIFGTCDLNNPNRIYTVLSGWALDLGLQEEDEGVGYVELMLDNTLFEQTYVGDDGAFGTLDDVEVDVSTRTGCFFSLATGGLTNCYGLPRLDIERFFPFAEDAPLSGFRFVLDVGYLINAGWVQGQHKIKLRAGDQATATNEFSEIKVNFLCQENFDDIPSIGLIEYPRPGRAHSGTLFSRGWAVDIDGIVRVEIYIDGNFVTNANYGVGSRPIVAQHYPGYPDALAPVWEAAIDTTLLTDGFRRMQVRAIDLNGNSTEIGDKEFVVNNDFDD
ncbi:MAG: hypothetical protein AAGE94_03140 [Acidobacteriota bacterium]